MTPNTRIVLRARNSSHGQCRCNRCSVSMPGPARRTAEEVVKALTDASPRSDSAITWRTSDPPLQRGYADRARSRAMGGYAAQQALEAIHTLLNVDGAGGFAEKNRMQQYRRDANTAARHPGLNAVAVARSLASHYWQSRSESARWCNCRLARALVGLDRAHARSP
jgi:hypothetical protein